MESYRHTGGRIYKTSWVSLRIRHWNGPSAELTTMAIPNRVQEMKNRAAFTAIVALGNLGVTIWHLRLASELNPELSFAEATRIGALTAVLTLAGVSLLWAKRKIAGSLVLVVVFAIGLTIGSLEHFFIHGPNNVFDAGVGGVAFLFRISVALLVALEVAGLWSAAGLIRSAWHSAA